MTVLEDRRDLFGLAKALWRGGQSIVQSSIVPGGGGGFPFEAAGAGFPIDEHSECVCVLLG